MLGVFAGYFFYDGKVGYRKKNEHFFYYKCFKDLESILVKKANEDSTKSEMASEENWREFASSQVIELPEDPEYTLPEGMELPQPWPMEIVNGYQTLNSDRAGWNKLWEQFTDRKGWSIKSEKGHKSKAKIQEQFNWSVGTGVVFLVILFFFLRTMMRRMVFHEGVFTAPNGKEISVDSIYKIDQRKWKTKGLATIYYKDEKGSEQKSRVDGMVYGQFQEEENPDHNAEKLYQALVAGFEGEIIDYDEDEDDDEDPSSSGPLK